MVGALQELCPVLAARTQRQQRKGNRRVQLEGGRILVSTSHDDMAVLDEFF